MKKIGFLFATIIMMLLFALSVSAESGNAYEVGDIIQFGSYPQSEVTDEMLISKLNTLAPKWEEWTSYGYYSSGGHTNWQYFFSQGDWMRYIDLSFDGSKYRGVKFTEYRPEATSYYLSSTSEHSFQDDNGYITNIIYWFKFEPIYWQVLDPKNGLVICETIIDSQPFSNTLYIKEVNNITYYFNDLELTNYSNDYGTSSIRRWLNEDFYDVAFKDSEKEEIKITTINNDDLVDVSFNGTFNSNVINDKIFLLSINEARNSSFGFNLSESRMAQCSDYSKSQGYYKGWLLRSPYKTYSGHCCFVDNCGYTDKFYIANYTSFGIRPVLRANLKSNMVQPKHEHVYTYEITKEATHTEDGVKTYVCLCGDYYTELIVKDIEHHYNSSITTEPTCWSDGIITYTCECGDSYIETLPKKEHEYGKWEVKTKPTCLKAGLEWSYCLNCDNDFEREIPAQGHTVIDYVMKASTDEMAAYGGDGAYITACDVCNEIFKQEFFARPAEYELSTSSYTYNGNVRKPTVTVKDADRKTLVEGQDYDVIYPDGMKLPGKYEVTVLFKGNYLGEKKLSFTIKPKATTGLKAKTQDTKTITLSWSKTTGAAGYAVYKYNSNTKKYERIKITASSSYKATALNAGSTYKFKVRPYTKAEDGTTIWGAYSSVFSTVTKTVKPTLKAASQSGGKVTLKWNNVSGENGYEIYYSTSKNGTYKKMSGVAANKTSYTTSKLAVGKTYYFKVRTYKTVGDVKVYSAFSDVKSIKIPVVYYITKTGKKYHVDGCRSLSQSKIQISYSNAVARGYKPCSSCIS